MSVSIPKAWLVLAALLLTGCAPDRPGHQDSPVPATAAEPGLQTSGRDAPQVQEGRHTVASEGAAAAGESIALLGSVVVVPFEHRQLHDRVRPGPGDVPERQIRLFARGTDHKALAIELEHSLTLAGFETHANENKDGWVWIRLRGPAGEGKVALRPESGKPGTVVLFKIPQA